MKMLSVYFLIPCLVISAHFVKAQGQQDFTLDRDIKSLIDDVDVNYKNDQYGNPLEQNNDDFEVEIFYRPEEAEENNIGRPPLMAHSPPHSIAPVRRLWGIDDTEAFIGRLFRYPIPDDAFQGGVKGYQIRNLPSWAWHNEKSGVIEGIPSVENVGHHYVTVKAKGFDGSNAKDVFSIVVQEVPITKLQKESSCRVSKKNKKGYKSLTIISILLKYKFSQLTPMNAVDLITTASKTLGIKQDHLSVVPAPHNYDPLAEKGAIIAGPGNIKYIHQGKKEKSIEDSPLTLLQWVVGCGEEISPEHQLQVDKTEIFSKDGTLQKAVGGINVIGWVVLKIGSMQKQDNIQRKRRAVEEYYYDYSGDDLLYDDYHYKEEIDEEVPASRVVPLMASPTFVGPIEATRTPGHLNEIRPDFVSAHFHPVILSTPVNVPVKPTRISAFESSPTYEPTDIPYFGIESSIAVEPTIMLGETVPLVSVTPALTDLTAPTIPLEPTSVPNVPITEYGVRNSPPRIMNRMNKLSWTAGHFYRVKIQNDTFYDLEEGYTRNLRLTFFKHDRSQLGSNSWIQFDAEKQEIYALPLLESEYGPWTFVIEATDSNNASVNDTIPIYVRQPKEGRNYHHKFSATFKIEKKYEYENFRNALDWKVLALQKIANLYNSSIDTINVKLITENPYKIVWSNISLVNQKSTECPDDNLKAVAQVLLAGSRNHEPSKAMKEVFRPEFHVKRVNAHYTRPCDHLNKPDREPDSTQEGATEVKYVNTNPEILNPIDEIKFVIGKFKRQQISYVTCYDSEEGDSRNLNIRLRTADLAPLAKNSWLQFDTTNQEFFGLPLKEDIKETEYVLECQDSHGAKDVDALIVKAYPESSNGAPPVIFTLTVSKNYNEFMNDPYSKMNLIEKIGKAFGDDSSNLRFTNIAAGSVVISWYNVTLPASPCPSSQIESIKSIAKDENGNLRPEFVKKFSPEFKVTNLVIKPYGECLGGGTPTHPEESDVAPIPPLIPTHKEESEAEGKSARGRENEEDYLLTFIVPAVIITVMLLLAAIIACCLYRRRRYGKMTMSDDRTFVSKGIPIIFAEELDDQSQHLHRGDPAKNPVIMKDEKPPLPPEYHPHNRSASPTPHNLRGSSPMNHAMQNDRPNSGGGSSDDAPYHPPPPFTNSQARNQRPNMPPAYRKTPTYVPP